VWSSNRSTKRISLDRVFRNLQTKESPSRQLCFRSDEKGNNVEEVKATMPDAKAVAESVKAWAADNSKFAGRLATGMPTAQALTGLGLELLRGNQIPEALSVLRSALALMLDDPVLWTNYGLALDKANFPSEAADCLENSVELSRHQPDTWLLLGIVRKKLGDPGAAETAFRVALEQEPNSSVAWQFLGLLKQEQRDFAGAIDCLTACIKADGTNAAVLANLGKLQYQLGRFPEADDAYTRAARLDPANSHYHQMIRKTSFLREVLEGESIDTAIANYQNSFSTEESRTEKDMKELFSSTFSLLSGFGHIDDAARLGRKRLELWPADPSTTYLLKAVAGDQTLDRSTPEYVVEHFDAFAEGFDAQLEGVLGYDVPVKICSAIREITVAGHLYNTLDAGCGTGLCGLRLRPFSWQLTGVDLSPKMLEQAARRKIYDTLVCEELTAFLNHSPGRFDLISAADVMIYFGDLAALFAATAASLRPGGLLAFSTESWAGEGYRLKPSGRFAQAPEYVRSVAAPAFVELVYLETTLRMEATKRLAGNLFIFRRR
jgi:predicted TPR repeat methyltransferase/Flp pilus assembly protein TadD